MNNINLIYEKVIDKININFDPNFLIDIYIRFVIIATIFFILYKYYLINITINNLLKLFETQIQIYLLKFQNLKKSNQTLFTYINNYFTKYINELNNTPSIINSKINDTNMIVIFVTMLLILLIIICILIYVFDGINKINFKNIFYSLIFNILFITITQFILFYIIYTYIDPITLYSFFYYDYDIKPVPIEEIQVQELLQYKIVSISKDSSQTLLINSSKTGTLFIFVNLSICVFIVMFILSIVNYLILYNNYSIEKNIIPFTKISLYIYIICTLVSFFIFIMLLLVLVKQI